MYYMYIYVTRWQLDVDRVCKSVSLRALEDLIWIEPTLIPSQDEDKAPLSGHFAPITPLARSAQPKVRHSKHTDF